MAERPPPLLDIRVSNNVEPDTITIALAQPPTKRKARKRVSPCANPINPVVMTLPRRASNNHLRGNFPIALPAATMAPIRYPNIFAEP